MAKSLGLFAAPTNQSEIRNSYTSRTARLLSAAKERSLTGGQEIAERRRENAMVKRNDRVEINESEGEKKSWIWFYRENVLKILKSRRNIAKKAKNRFRNY